MEKLQKSLAAGAISVYNAKGYFEPNTVRLYRPRPEILNGTWKFPEPEPAS
jgi:hypothetical protein